MTFRPQEQASKYFTESNNGGFNQWRNEEELQSQRKYLNDANTAQFDQSRDQEGMQQIFHYMVGNPGAYKQLKIVLYGVAAVVFGYMGYLEYSKGRTLDRRDARQSIETEDEMLRRNRQAFYDREASYSRPAPRLHVPLIEPAYAAPPRSNLVYRQPRHAYRKRRWDAESTSNNIRSAEDETLKNKKHAYTASSESEAVESTPPDATLRNEL
jgi:hypothetical protein